MIGYLRAFLPWITFIALVGHMPRLAALVAFVLAALFVVHSRSRRAAWSALVIEFSSAVFFGALAVAACTGSPLPLGTYAAAAAAGWLAVTAWGTLALGRPFTLAIAREMAPPEARNSPLFYRANIVLTAVWATGFTLEAVSVAAVLSIVPHSLAALITAKVACLSAPMLFTMRYPAIVARQAERRQLQHPTHPQAGYPQAPGYPRNY